MTRPSPPEQELLAPDEEQALITMLKNTWSPSRLSSSVNAFIVEQALIDPLASATADELAQATELREALAAGAPPSHSLVEAARTAMAPEALNEARLRDLALAALGSAPPKDAGSPPESLRSDDTARRQATATRGQIIYVTFGVGAALAAIAAGALLFLRPAPEAPISAGYLRSRSTAGLFSEPFKPGEASTRVDVIAQARLKEARANRYARWGIR